MRRILFAAAVVTATVGAFQTAFAQGILSPADTIIGIDLDPPVSRSNFPAGEAPAFAIDSTLDTKYLNFAGAGSGLIVTPATAGATIANGLRLTTGNDAEGRDPASYEVWGTNATIESTVNSTGLAESWDLIASGALSLLEVPSARLTVGDLVPFSNTAAYASYKLYFPEVKNSTLFQVDEIELLADAGTVSEVNLFAGASEPIGIHLGPDSKFPSGESPDNLLDGDSNTKYLNFGKENAGFIVTPESGASTVKSFRLATANDFPGRDPSTYELYGTNDEILSEVNSQADSESWTLISSGETNLPEDRFAAGPFTPFDNQIAYTSYRMVFPELRDTTADRSDSIQFSGVQFYSVAIPEPSSGLIALGLFAIGLGTRSRS